MNTPDTPLISIVDDDPTLRDDLRRLLESVGLRAQAFDGLDSFLSSHRPEQPGCLILDIHIAGCQGEGAQQCLRHRKIELPVIMTASRCDIETVVTVMKQGALDFIEKPFNEQLLLDSVHHAITEGQNRRRAQAWRQDLLGRFDTLTPREQDVLRWVAEGLSNREIAETLNLSRKTVEIHRAKVMQKMRAETLSRLIQMAMVLGILKLYDPES